MTLRSLCVGKCRLIGHFVGLNDGGWTHFRLSLVGQACRLKLVGKFWAEGAEITLVAIERIINVLLRDRKPQDVSQPLARKERGKAPTCDTATICGPLNIEDAGIYDSRTTSRNSGVRIEYEGVKPRVRSPLSRGLQAKMDDQ